MQRDYFEQSTCAPSICKSSPRRMAFSSPSSASKGRSVEVESTSSSPKWIIIDAYERRLRSVASLAEVAAALQKMSQFLEFCGLTWATVVVLGGFVTEVSREDYYLVTVLLLWEACRLGAAMFLGNLVTKKLVYLSPMPTKLEYHDSRRQVRVAIIRILDQAFQLILTAVSIFLSLLRLRHLKRQGIVFPGQHSESFSGLGNSLFLFYSVVLASASVSGFGVLYSKSFVLLVVNTPSLQRYFDEIACRGWSENFLAASEFDFLAFSFKVQAAEYRRNVQPVVVFEVYKDMLEYLYMHEKGPEAARIALESGDSYEQQAAASVVGLWVGIERERGRKMLRRMPRLLAKLAKAAAGEGKTGRAAVLSLEKLAEWDAEAVMQIRWGEGEGVAKGLMRSISEEVEGRPDETLVYVKATVALLKEREKLRERVGEEAWAKLRKDLWSVWEDGRSRVRTKAVAGWALLKMGEEIEGKSVRKNLVGSVVKRGEYVHWETELEYVQQLLRIDGLKELPEHWKRRLQIRSTHPRLLPQSWVARPSTMLLSALLTLLLLALAISTVFQKLELFTAVDITSLSAI